MRAKDIEAHKQGKISKEELMRRHAINEEEYEKTMQSVFDIEYKIYIESVMFINFTEIDISNPVRATIQLRTRTRSDEEKKQYYLDKMNCLYKRIQRLVIEQRLVIQPIKKEISNSNNIDEEEENIKKFNFRLDKLRPHYSFAKRYIYVLDKDILNRKKDLNENTNEVQKRNIANIIKTFQNIKKYLWILVQMCESEHYKNSCKNNLNVLDKIHETLHLIYIRQNGS